jgi:hypothetical protein
MPSLTIWTRLEPRCRAADMTVALEARTHDPLWMLARQWQLGELLGDDAGSPIVASITSIDTPLDRYAGPGGITEQVPASMPLEAWVEREGVRPSGGVVDYRQTAESGLQFLRMLRAAHMDHHIPAYVTRYALAAPSATDLARMDTPAGRLIGVVATRVPDGVRLASELRAALPVLPALPAIASPDVTFVLGVAKDFLAWYDALFDEPRVGAGGTDAGTTPPPPSSAWVNERMEYSFALDASATDTPGAFVASQYMGEPLAWTSFDCTANPLGAVTAPVQSVTRTLIPTPVGFKGMPARRFWEMEDAVVDIGAIEAGPADLGRLMLREFALIYGNDWFVVPIPVLVGSVSRVTSLVVTDTFGVSQTIPHYSQTADGGRWWMFAVTGDAAPHRLLMPPVLARTIASDPIEQILLVRDETANMAWGIERIVQGASGAPFDRASVPPPPSGASDATSHVLRYQLGTSVPEAYIPFIPSQTDAVQRRMRRAALLRTDGTAAIVAPLGRLLAADVALFEEEFPREGVKVERRYMLARWVDGSTHLWIARRKEIGATAASSGLQFDRVLEQ